MSHRNDQLEDTLPLSKRRRVTRACDNCKSRKRRCNGEKPCAYCTEHRALCTYDAPYTRGKADNNTSPATSNVPASLRRPSQWPNTEDRPMGSRTSSNKDISITPRSKPSWPRNSLITTVIEDDERTGAQSSRARSPIGGEGAAPMGQYLGPTSPFSVGRLSPLSASHALGLGLWHYTRHQTSPHCPRKVKP